EAALVDYPGVSAAKHEVLRELYAGFRREHLGRATPRAARFRRFQARAGEALRRHALFEALQGHLHSVDRSIWGWPAWPEALRDLRSPAVREFEAQAIESIEYHEYLQWQAALQLERAAARC